MLNKVVSGILLMLCMNVVSAEAQIDAVKANLEKAIPGIQLDQISATPIQGLYQVTMSGRIVYVSADGRYILQGDLYDRETTTNLTETARSSIRKAALQKFDDSKTIAFSPENPKHSITIFTDTSCGFCRKLHQEIPALNAKGIKVKYMLFPRAGVGSPSYKVLQSVWCAKDQQAAMDTAKAGGSVPEKACDNPIEEHLNIGRQVGLQGTPMIVTDDGNIIQGYRPADQLITLLESSK